MPHSRRHFITPPPDKHGADFADFAQEARHSTKATAFYYIFWRYEYADRLASNTYRYIFTLGLMAD